MEILSYVIIGIGILFMIFGVIGIYQPNKDFYYRILVACKVDTVGFLTFCIGMAIRHGFSFFTGKIFIILLLMMVLNPLVAHIVSRSAYTSGYLPGNEEAEDDDL